MNYKLQKNATINIKDEKTNWEDKLYDRPRLLQILCLQDKKILICEIEKDIIILNQNTFRFLYYIKRRNNSSFCSATQIKSSGNIACCEDSGDISIYSIKKIPTLIQVINVLSGKKIYKLKEISNDKLISCQYERSIILYEYNQKQDIYNISNKVNLGEFIDNIQPTKNNDVLLYETIFLDTYHIRILLFDAEKLKVTKEIISCKGNGGIYEPFCFLSKSILSVVIQETIFLLDINKDYSLITKIESKNSSRIYSICAFNNNKLVTGDVEGNLILWNFENNSINKIDE